jgi:protein phosphatase PTC6
MAQGQPAFNCRGRQGRGDRLVTGGYFKRFQGGILSSIEDSSLSIAERLTLSFLKVSFLHPYLFLLFRKPQADQCLRSLWVQADQTILRDIPQAEVCGSTGSIALLHSLDTPTTTPFFEARKLSVTVAHCG